MYISVRIGNPFTQSNTSLSVPQDVTFLLLDFNLTNGSLYQFHLTTVDRTSPLRLQIWRPTADGPYIYTLIHETRYVGKYSGNFSVCAAL